MPSASDAAIVPPEHQNEDGTFTVWSPTGCGACGSSGYRGRFAIHEVLLMTDEVRDLILQGGSSDQIERLAVSQGMLTLRNDGLFKALSGLTSLEEILRIVN